MVALLVVVNPSPLLAVEIPTGRPTGIRIKLPNFVIAAQPFEHR
jgi:hypothetical protein